MKPPSFEYFAPTSLSEAVSLLDQSENARVLAGGQSLMAMLNMRFVFPDQIIDLNRIPELDYIQEEEGDVVVGAMTRQRKIERSPLIISTLPVIPKALRYVGHIQTRNRGTIGGSLCQLDPSAELPALAAAYDASLEITGPQGRRRLPFCEFPSFYMTPALEPNEILTGIRFRGWSGRIGTGFCEFSRRHGDFAIAGAIALLALDADGSIERVSLTAFGIAHAPVRVASAEALLLKQKPRQDLFVEASAFCRDAASLEDAYASADYRGHVAAAMMERALLDALSELKDINEQ